MSVLDQIQLKIETKNKNIKPGTLYDNPVVYHQLGFNEQVPVAYASLETGQTYEVYLTGTTRVVALEKDQDKYGLDYITDEKYILENFEALKQNNCILNSPQLVIKDNLGLGLENELFFDSLNDAIGKLKSLQEAMENGISAFDFWNDTLPALKDKNTLWR